MLIKLYGIVELTSNETIYVGASSQQLCKRMGTHRSIVRHGTKCHNGEPQPVHQYMRARGIENFAIKLLRFVEVANFAGMRERERECICEMNPRFYNLMVHVSRTKSVKDSSQSLDESS